MTHTDKNGFTLIELVLSLAIASLLLGFGLPSFSDMLDKNKIRAQSLQLISTLSLARQTAVNERKTVTVCPTQNNRHCEKNWSKGYMAFIDENRNRQRDQDDRVLIVSNVTNPDISLRWRAFGHKSSLQWYDTGITNHQNGSFEYCYQKNPRYARALIITKSGRVRVSKDKDGDGIHENARGQNLSC